MRLLPRPGRISMLAPGPQAGIGLKLRIWSELMPHVFFDGRTVLKPAAMAFGLGMLAFQPQAAHAQAESEKIENPVAVFSGLDKITGRIINFDVYIGETVQFGALQVTPRVCHTRPQTESPLTTGEEMVGAGHGLLGDQMPFCCLSFSTRPLTSFSGATLSASPWMIRPEDGQGARNEKS
jgi:hypothetical protein